jgi:hypothetical protein
VRERRRERETGWDERRDGTRDEKVVKGDLKSNRGTDIRAILLFFFIKAAPFHFFKAASVLT